MKKILALLLTAVLALSTLAACGSPQNNSAQATPQPTEGTPTQNSGNDESAVPEPELPAGVSNIASVENVPLLTLNNGVQLPGLGLAATIDKQLSSRSGILSYDAEKDWILLQQEQGKDLLLDMAVLWEVVTDNKMGRNQL